jgi:uncharacterized protein (UPF0262 family)
MSERHRLVDIALDEASLSAASRDAEHERRIAIFDLMEGNVFEVEGVDEGPYALTLSLRDQRLVFDVQRAKDRAQIHTLILSLSTFRRVIKDYFMVCDSYNDAIKRGTTQAIEAIDMGRRGLHNEGAELLTQRLAGKFKIDNDTARRLFTLICALHVRL